MTYAAEWSPSGDTWRCCECGSWCSITVRSCPGCRAGRSRAYATLPFPERTSTRAEVSDAVAFTFEKLAEILRDLGPIPPRPVIILASWLPRDRVIKRTCPATADRPATEEWRIHPASFQAMKAAEPMPEPHRLLESLWEIKVEPGIEAMPPRELVEEMIGPMRDPLDPEAALAELREIYTKRLAESMRQEYEQAGRARLPIRQYLV